MGWEEFAERFAAVDWYSPERVRLVAESVPDAQLHLDLEQLDRPFAGREFAGLPDVQAAVASHIEHDLRLRTGPDHSETLALFTALLKVYMELGRLVPPERLNARSQQDGPRLVARVLQFRGLRAAAAPAPRDAGPAPGRGPAVHRPGAGGHRGGGIGPVRRHVGPGRRHGVRHRADRGPPTGAVGCPALRIRCWASCTAPASVPNSSCSARTACSRRGGCWSRTTTSCSARGRTAAHGCSASARAPPAGGGGICEARDQRGAVPGE